MKFFIHKNKTNFKEYSVRLIGNTLKKWIVNDPKHADFILLSMCDINEIGDIEKAKQCQEKNSASVNFFMRTA